MYIHFRTQDAHKSSTMMMDITYGNLLVNLKGNLNLETIMFFSMEVSMQTDFKKINKACT